VGQEGAKWNILWERFVTKLFYQLKCKQSTFGAELFPSDVLSHRITCSISQTEGT